MRNIFRNVLVVLIVLLANQVFAAEYATFDSFYSNGGIGVWGWVGIGVGTVAVAALTFCTLGAGGATVPGWMAAVGGWIGSAAGYSGAAATSYGLALLGGGSVAAGGLGMAGGAAVLAAALSFGTDVAISYGVDAASEAWSSSKFVEANKEMLTLPIPRNTKGGNAYVMTVEFLQKNINSNEPLQSKDNQSVLESAKVLLETKMPLERDNDFKTKDMTLMALLCLQTCDFKNAFDWGQKANNLARRTNNKSTLPLFIMALAHFSSPEVSNTIDVIKDDLKPSYEREPKNKLIVLMTGCCVERLMYKYHFGQIGSDDILWFWSVVTGNKIKSERAAEAMSIVVARALVEMKRTQQDIIITCKDEMGLREEKGVVPELERRYNSLNDLVNIMSAHLMPRLKELESDLPKDSKIRYAEVNRLLMQYKAVMKDLWLKIHPENAETMNCLWGIVIIAIFILMIVTICIVGKNNATRKME